MPKQHQVQQGECLESIAAHYGYMDYRTIFNHPLNARLKEKRRNPNLLYPGDILFIPDKQEKQDPRATGRMHEHTVKVPTVLLRIYLKDRRGKPLSNVSYELRSPQKTLTGTTDKNGLLHKEVPIAMSCVDLVLEDIGKIRTLLIGHLDPIDTLSGVQARLSNLGYDVGPIDGIEGPRTRAAIYAFQQDHPELDANGICNAATRAKILEKHGC